MALDKLHPLYQQDLEYIASMVDAESLKGKCFLITGATGLIGTQMIDALMYIGGVKVIATGRSKEKASLRFGEYFSNPMFTFLEQDVNEPFGPGLAPDYILPLASNTHPLAYSKYPVETIMTNIDGARNAFELACSYSGQELSLTKMMGQMMDAGNTTTISGYLNLLGQAGLVCALGKYSNDDARKRASAPKHQVMNNALKTVYATKTFEQAYTDRKYWGRIYESAVGAHITSHAYEGDYKVWYWRDYKNNEVDYILEKKGKLVAIEVKSNQDKSNTGLVEFKKIFNPVVCFVVGDGGMPVEDFLSCNPKDLF